MLQTAAAYGLLERPVDLTRETLPALVTDTWLPLAKALSQINRSMGLADLYPFVLTAPVITKLGFVVDLVAAAPRPGLGP